MPEDGFPLPGSSYRELCKIIAGYSEIVGPSSPSEVSQLIGIHESQVSRNNKFLVATGVVQGGQKKSCTDLGAALGRAVHFDQTQAIKNAWKTIYESTEFFQKVVTAIRIRKGMEESALLSHIAFTSGNSKTGFSMAGAGAVVEILKIIGVIESKGGTVVASEIQPELDAKTSSGSATAHQEEIEANHPIIDASETKILRAASTSLKIVVNISCSPNELGGLGEKLRQLRKEYESENSETKLEIDIQSDDAGE